MHIVAFSPARDTAGLKKSVSGAQVLPDKSLCASLCFTCVVQVATKRFKIKNNSSCCCVWENPLQYF